MSTFTEELKNEIIRTPVSGKRCQVAFLSAFIRTSGNVFSRGGVFGFEIITENENTAEFICDLLEACFSVSMTVSDAQFDIKSGRDKIKFECLNDKSAQILQYLGLINIQNGEVSVLFGIDDKIIGNDSCKVAYLKGAFLGGGSCTLPNEQTYSRTGYHFEVVFSNKITAQDYCDLLCDFEILAKLVSRKDWSVVYVKSKEVISDILSVIQTYNCLTKLNRIVELKDKINNQNRISNCSVSNIDKTVKASVAQIKAIEIISQTVGLQSLDANLFEVAEARLADTNASMQELADRLKISKSCINHRMRKIIAISTQLL